MNIYPLFRKILFCFDAETAHEFSLNAMSLLQRLGLLGLFLRISGVKLKQSAEIQMSQDLSVDVMGLHFPNPVGLAAGLDKNARHIKALAQCGFGFIEVGTVTPRAQPGNDKPRMFRLQADRAIINRMGFNNDGVDTLVRNVRAVHCDCVLGINIGKNKTTPLESAVDDYLACLQKVYDCADYVTVNISSPNTPGLRALQHGEGLENLLSQLKASQAELAKLHARYVPLLVKIAPDLSDEEIKEIAATLLKSGIDGVIATNTTNQRMASLRETTLASESGGLSGAPLTPLADAVLEKLLAALDGNIPVIAVGGIMCAEDARRKLKLGASLVQVYSGFVYAGPALVQQCLDVLAPPPASD